MPGVAESAVIGVPHPDFGEGVTAVVVRAPGATLDGGGDHRGARRSGSPGSSCRSAWSFVDDLPRNTMGKVQKNVLRETYGGLYAL